MKPTSKVIQIQHSHRVGYGEIITLLCEDGSVWETNYNSCRCILEPHQPIKEEK